jgi:hypothetical protein
MITRVLGFRLVLISLLSALVVWGCCDTDYSAVLNIGPGYGALKCPDGTTNAYLGCSLQPNPVPPNHLDIYVNTTVSDTSLDLYRLIIGVPLPSGAGAPLPQIDYIEVRNGSGTLTSTYNPNISAAYCGSLDPGENNAYQQCMPSYGGISGGNTFAAWQAADAAIGINATSFALYSYDISPAANVGTHWLYDTFLTGNLPIGTIEIAYGCTTAWCDKDCFVTPWQNAGQVVPEPSSLLLVGGAALALLGARLRRKKR